MRVAATPLQRRARNMISGARTRAKARGLPFALGDREQRIIEGILERGECEMTGIKFSGPGKRSGFSASLDRIVPAKGYVPGNVRVVCLAMNSALGDWGEEPLREVMKTWLVQAPRPLAITKPPTPLVPALAAMLLALHEPDSVITKTNVRDCTPALDYAGRRAAMKELERGQHVEVFGGGWILRDRVKREAELFG